MTIKLLYGYGKELLIKETAKIKKGSGVRCTDCIIRPLVETATGKHVMDLYELTFQGSIWQCFKARKIIDSLSHK